ncbi:DUF3027 domain-containing protein [Luteimicrobium subarcticum]|uniref:DUF3027 family protein n=1 Tax=Luteimicrobium subarcticum TaxID=620910 RepID=A0A2M8WSX8_9MICO|nr:DUF3027 domain-containing protein [Luteimicrobium subarcticum]PJI94004.1 Protein of unknown function (DUF3027) [Luteimicrobium subarcticum]
MPKDAVLESAVDLARAAAEGAAEHTADVGDHLGAIVDADRLVTHRFACTLRGYTGWYWSVAVSRIPRSRTATICEVALLPGDGALLAPSWLPWSERLRPGDVGPGDVLPFLPDDPRLVPGWSPEPGEGSSQGTADDDDLVPIDELAVARVRVLGRQGRDEAAERWYQGSRGPTSPGAVAAESACGSCGFLVPLQGALGQVFGVCANAWSSDDGKVVSLDHGCGAHSETDVPAHPSDWPAPDPLIDELVVDVVAEAPSAAEAPAADAPAAEVPAADAPEADAAPADAAPAEAPADEPSSDESTGTETAPSA